MSRTISIRPRRLAMIALAGAAALATPAAASPLCQQVQNIGAGASGGFASLRGEARNLTPTWVKYQATETLSGAAGCDIDGISGDYTCRWELGSRGQAKAKQADLAREVAACLGQAPKKLPDGAVGFFAGSWRQPGAYKVEVWSSKSTATVVIGRY